MTNFQDTIHDSSRDQLLVESKGLEQPLDTIALKAPQLLAFDFLINPQGRMASTLGGVLSLDKGMGKTITYLAAALQNDPEYVIISCPTNAMPAQRREILRHFPDFAEDFVFVRGDRYKREKLWQSKARIFITTQATLQADMGGRLKSGPTIVPSWVYSSHLDALIVDEFHKTMRNRTSKTPQQLKRLNPKMFIPASGSAANKGPQDLWAVLNVLDPKKWSSYWKYVNKYCDVRDGAWGKEIIGVRNIEEWRKDVAPYIFHRKKDPKDYPLKERFFLDVELAPWQKKLHDQLIDQLMAERLDGSLVIAQTAMDKVIKARISLICPKVIDHQLGYGAGLETILADYKDSELTHAVISTPFKAPLPHVARFLGSNGIKTYTLAGGLGITPDEQDRIINTWTKTGGIVIQTIKYATSYELLAAQHMYMLGCEGHEDNKQAEDRIHRLSSTHPVNIWYVRHLNTYEEEVLERMLANALNIYRLMDSPLAFQRFLRGKHP